MFKLLTYLFSGCSHQKTTFPMRPRNGAKGTEYVTCLGCGKEFHYDWANMRVGEEATAGHMQNKVRSVGVKERPIHG